MWVFKADKNANITKIMIFGMVSPKDSMNFCPMSCKMVETLENYCVYSCISQPFMTKKSSQKITLTYTQVIHNYLNQTIQDTSIAIAWSLLGKLSLFIEHSGEPQLGNQANLRSLCLLQFARFMGWCDIFFAPIGSCN